MATPSASLLYASRSINRSISLIRSHRKGQALFEFQTVIVEISRYVANTFHWLHRTRCSSRIGRSMNETDELVVGWMSHRRRLVKFEGGCLTLIVRNPFHLDFVWFEQANWSRVLKISKRMDRFSSKRVVLYDVIKMPSPSCNSFIFYCVLCRNSILLNIFEK